MNLFILSEPFFKESTLRVLRVYIRFADGLNERVGRVVSWLTAVLVAVVCYDVFTRYLLENSLVAVQELQWHLFALIFLIGAAYSLKHDNHVRVDLFYSRFSRRKQACVNLFGSLLFLIPFCIIVIVSSQSFVANAFRIGEISPDSGWPALSMGAQSGYSPRFFLSFASGPGSGVSVFAHDSRTG